VSAAAHAPRLTLGKLACKFFRSTVDGWHNVKTGGSGFVYRVGDGEVGEELLAELEQNRMKGLAFRETGFRKITNSVRPIRTPCDLRGLNIRTTPNPAHVQAFELWVAAPKPMAFTELYLALETGTVDGQENPLNIIRSNRFQEVQSHLSFTDHAYTISIVSI
jgi:TRAP-type transport system periplasmic protein